MNGSVTAAVAVVAGGVREAELARPARPADSGEQWPGWPGRYACQRGGPPCLG